MDARPTFRRSSVLGDLRAARAAIPRASAVPATPARAVDDHGNAVAVFLVLGGVGLAITAASFAGILIAISTDASLAVLGDAIGFFLLGVGVMAVSVTGAAIAAIARVIRNARR